MPKVNVKDKRRQQLIEANIASIARRGFTETTITHISQGAGMSRGIVNFYFTTKESMMQATCRYIAEEYTAVWRASLEKYQDSPALDKLRAMVQANFHKSVCSEKRLAVWAAFCGHAATHNEYRKILAKFDGEHLNSIAVLWKAAHDKDSVSKEKAEEFASHLHAMTRGLWMAYLLAPSNNDRETLTNICLSFIDDKHREVTGNVVALREVKTTRSVDKTKKPQGKAPEGQLDFGDLFSVAGKTA